MNQNENSKRFEDFFFRPIESIREETINKGGIETFIYYMTNKLYLSARDLARERDYSSKVIDRITEVELCKP